MSDETMQPSGQQPAAEVAEQDFVSKKAYEQVTKDMHKFKSRLKETEAAKAEYEAKLKALEEEKLREGEQWKELSEKYKAELDEAKQTALRLRESTITSAKRSALKAELGDINDIYLVHADIDSIEVNEHGVPDRESLLDVANRFRKEHPILFQGSKSSNVTSFNAPINSTVQTQEKTLDQMSFAEKAQYLKSLKQKSS